MSEQRRTTGGRLRPTQASAILSGRRLVVALEADRARLQARLTDAVARLRVAMSNGESG